MSERRYILNKKALAVTRALGKSCNSRWKYVYVDGAGATATDQSTIIRVTLPKSLQPLPSEPRIFPIEQVTELRENRKDDDVIVMPEGLEAKSSGEYSVPNYDYVLPKQNEVQASITLSGQRLIELIKAACDVTEHSLSLMRLSICKDGTMLKVETHRADGEQEFTGLQMTLKYDGVGIPNSVLPSNTTPTEKTEFKKLTLPIQGGRKFRE